jgi:hypothetical protein
MRGERRKRNLVLVLLEELDQLAQLLQTPLNVERLAALPRLAQGRHQARNRINLSVTSFHLLI